MIDLTDVLKREYGAAEKCHICLKEFHDPEKRKVTDHCRYMGLYHAVTHNTDNIKYQIPDYNSIVFYKLSGYDTHLSIKELGKKFSLGKV